MRCYKCGSNVHELLSYCSKCGTRLADGGEQQQSREIPAPVPPFVSQPIAPPVPPPVAPPETAPIHVPPATPYYDSDAQPADQIPPADQFPPADRFQPAGRVPDKKKTKLLPAIIAAAVIIIAAVAVLVVLNRNGNSDEGAIRYPPSDGFTGGPSGGISSPGQAGTSGGNQTDSPAQTGSNGGNQPDIPKQEETTPVPDTPPGSKYLSSLEAYAIAQTWLDSHPIEYPNILEYDYDDISAFGEEYYAFYLDSWYMYWFSILVNKETGELFCMITDDGQYPADPVIEPLDYWYILTYGAAGGNPGSANTPQTPQYPPPVFYDATASGFTAPTSVASYEPDKAIDGNPVTAWQVPEGGNPWIRLTNPEPQYVSGVYILNGYAKYSDNRGEWLYYLNHRPKDITISFSDGSSVWTTLDDVFDGANLIYHDIQLSSPVLTTYIQITINSFYAGSVWKDICISEIAVY